MFFTVVNNLFNCFQDICNPFKEDELIVLDTGEVMIPDSQSCLDNLLEINEEKYQNFCKRRLIICDVAIMATIKNNPLNLLSSFDPDDDKACIPQIQEKKEEKFDKAAYSSFLYLDSIIKECFSTWSTLISFTEFHAPMSEKRIIQKNQIN